MIFWFLAVLAVATRAVGDFRDPVYAFLMAILLGFFWLGCPSVPSWGKKINWLLRWSSWALAVGLVAWADPPLKIAMVTAAVWAFDRYTVPENRGKNSAVVLTGILYGLWWTIFFMLPPLYHLMSQWSFGYTQVITGVMVKPLSLGPSASAVDLLLLGVCAILGVTVAATERRWTWAVLGIVLLEAGRIIYIWMAPALLGLVGKVAPISQTPHLDMPGAYLLFITAVVALYRKALPAEDGVTPSAVPGNRRVTWVAIGALMAAFIVAGAGSYTNRPIRVLFLDKKTLDMTVPRHGQYGDRSGGMFGFLPTHLAASGYITYNTDLTPGILDSVDVIIIANLLKKLPVNERQMVWDFVDRGGGLLILADHTGTDAIREPTNDLLAPCGLSVNFDTAVPVRRSWVSEKSYLFHPVARSGGVMDGELWLGASVDPGPHGEPILVGRGAFSDPGDLNNKNRSFLGNLAYDPGESLGDIVLVAGAHWGRGRAMLYGDTSPYQNGSLTRTHALVDRSMHWLANRGIGRILDRWRSWMLAWLVGVGGTVLVVRSKGRPCLLWSALLLPVVSVAFWMAVPGPESRTWASTSYRQALIDLGQSPFFDGMAWEPQSIGGLEFNLMRNGLAPRYADSPSQIDSDSAAVYVLFAPTVAVSSETIDRFERYTANGGWLIVSAGWNLHTRVDDLLNRFGLAMENVPLGEAMGTAFGDSVKMADAYPLTGDGPNIETLVTALGYPVVKVARHGRGGMVVIADSQFLYNRNLEGQNELLVMENVRFFQNLIQHLMGGSKTQAPGGKGAGPS